MSRRTAILVTAASCIAGCGSGGATSTAAKCPIKYDAACQLSGTERPARQTLVVIDEQSISRSGPTDFRARNPGVIEAVIAVADPEQAVGLGALAPRERVSLFVAPADGSAPRMLFTGCAPAVSAEEQAKLAQGSSATERGTEWFFASGTGDQIKAQAEEFRTRLLGAVQRVAEAAPEKAGRAAENFEATPIVRSLRAASRIADPVEGAPRVVLIAPAALRSVPKTADGPAARRAGFAAAAKTGLDFGMADVVLPLVTPSASRDYVEAFLLGSRGRLIDWSSGAPTDLAAPPTSVRHFAGTIQYGPVQFPVRIRLGMDGVGRLSDSWIMVMNEQESATPLSGSAVCDANGDCRVTGDGRGFSQSWSPNPGGEPEFSEKLPFSGLRYFDLTIARGRGSGRVHDPLVDEIGGLKDLKFKLAEVTG